MQYDDVYGVVKKKRHSFYIIFSVLFIIVLQITVFGNLDAGFLMQDTDAGRKLR